MIKIATFSLKDIFIKFFISATFISLIIYVIKISDIEKININLLRLTISNNIPIYKSENVNDKNEKLFNILKNEIYVLNNKNYKEKTKKEDEQVNQQQENLNNTNNVETCTNLNINDIDNKTYNIDNNISKIQIRNNTSYNIDIDNLLKQKLNISTDKNKLTILIVHTHGSESYTGIEHTDYFRNEDITKNMVRVGDELEAVLKNSGYNVIHDKTLYDYPTYSGSYTRALETINSYIDRNPNIDIVLDIHRDAIGSKPDFAPSINIDNNEMSKLMFVVGTNEGGLEHPNWEENFKLALKLQNTGVQMYGNCFREMVLTKSRYNQHTTKGSLILEVGATGNTLEQSIMSMRYFAKILDTVLNEK